jgi:hypothetical protein
MASEPPLARIDKGNVRASCLRSRAGGSAGNEFNEATPLVETASSTSTRGVPVKMPPRARPADPGA